MKFRKMVNLEQKWLKELNEEFSKDYMINLESFLLQEAKSKKIYPSDIYRAFNLTPLDQVRVIILGQDPYHGANQADGLAFSVKDKTSIPPSLKNIYKEIEKDLGVPSQTSGDLTKWAKQGVLLMNSILTVEHGNAGSKKRMGKIYR